MRSNGQVDLQEMLQQARRMQQELVAAQSELSDLDVTGRAGPDLVAITMSAGGDFKSVVIDRSAVDPNDVETLEALVLTALRDAAGTIRDATDAKLRPLTEAFGG
jgi:DNA-binding YbaB/EbfC family protein